MKMMEILKMWVRCIVAAGQIEQRPIALRQLIILARAAQEYHTSGLHTKDIIEEIRNAHSHPYIYDGTTPDKPQGLAKIIGKYNIKNPYIHVPENLAGALSHDIKYGSLQASGDIDYNNTRWPTSVTLCVGFIGLNPKDGLPLALGKMLASARQK